MPQLEENYIATGKVVYIFYQFPLTSIHPNAQAAAEASECAGLQGKFWEMHDQLFANQSSWASSDDTLSIFMGYATALGLNETDFGACLAGNGGAPRIMADSNFAAGLGITGTPFFFFKPASGQIRYANGAMPYDSLQQGLDNLLANP